MLTLTRKCHEQIVIDVPGYPIVVEVSRIRGDRVWVSIDAPVEVPVHRREVYDRIHKDRGQQDDNGS